MGVVDRVINSGVSKPNSSLMNSLMHKAMDRM